VVVVVEVPSAAGAVVAAPSAGAVVAPSAGAAAPSAGAAAAAVVSVVASIEEVSVVVVSVVSAGFSPQAVRLTAANRAATFSTFFILRSKFGKGDLKNLFSYRRVAEVTRQ
jgi:hypothetical protein